MRGYAYDRRDVTGRGLANAYAQTLGTIFSSGGEKPYEVELFVGRGRRHRRGRLDLPADLRRSGRRRARLRRDGRLGRAGDDVPQGALPDRRGARGRRSGSPCRRSARARATPRAIPSTNLEVAVLDRTRTQQRKFKRLTAEQLGRHPRQRRRTRLAGRGPARGRRCRHPRRRHRPLRPRRPDRPHRHRHRRPAPRGPRLRRARRRHPSHPPHLSPARPVELAGPARRATDHASLETGCSVSSHRVVAAVGPARAVATGVEHAPVVAIGGSGADPAWSSLSRPRSARRQWRRRDRRGRACRDHERSRQARSAEGCIRTGRDPESRARERANAGRSANRPSASARRFARDRPCSCFSQCEGFRDPSELRGPDAARRAAGWTCSARRSAAACWARRTARSSRVLPSYSEPSAQRSM